MGVVDSEYVFHKGIQTLGGSGHRITKVHVSSFPNCGIHSLQSVNQKYKVRAPTWYYSIFSIVVTWKYSYIHYLSFFIESNSLFLMTLNLRTNMVFYISFRYVKKSVPFSLYSFVWTNLLVWIIAPIKLCCLLFCC